MSSAHGTADGVADLRIDRDSVAGTAERLRHLAAQPGVRCAVLEIMGAGRADHPPDAAELPTLRLPVIAVFEDVLQGGLLSLALAADIRLCGAGAGMDLASVNEAWTEARLRLLNPAVGGRSGRLGARDLLDLGLVSGVYPDAGAEARRLAETIAARGPIATALGKEAVWRGLVLPLEQALRLETDLTLLLQTTKDRAEGVRAFLEKRAPQFKGE